MTKNVVNSNVAVLNVVKNQGVEETGMCILSTGIRARLRPVAPYLIDDVRNQLVEPKVPMWMNPDKDREEPNPFDPGYVANMTKYVHDVALATMDTLIVFGLELLDGIPDKSEWLSKLQFLQKRTKLDLSMYDLEDSRDLEFMYKKYIAVGADDMQELSKMAGLTPQEVNQAAAGFRGNEER